MKNGDLVQHRFDGARGTVYEIVDDVPHSDYGDTEELIYVRPVFSPNNLMKRANLGSFTTAVDRRDLYLANEMYVLALASR